MNSYYVVVGYLCFDISYRMNGLVIIVSLFVVQETEVDQHISSVKEITVD